MVISALPLAVALVAVWVRGGAALALSGDSWAENSRESGSPGHLRGHLAPRDWRFLDRPRTLLHTASAREAEARDRGGGDDEDLPDVSDRDHLDQVAKDLDEKTGGAIKDVDKALHEHMEKLHKQNEGHIKKPLMHAIDILRTQLCLSRPNLPQHQECMAFLGLKCMKETTGQGGCHQFLDTIEEACKENPEDEDVCNLATALGRSIHESDEAEEEEEREEEEEVEEKLEEEEQKEEEEEAEEEETPEEEEEKEEPEKAEEKEEEPAEIENKTETDDRDGDGVPDSEDAFPDDAEEWKDLDKDGIGDNADEDRDGDNITNDEDAFPNDATEWKDTDGDGIGDNTDPDRDGDGYPNDDDVFPDDHTEWRDSDGDGVGDNKDAYPMNPNCHSALEPCEHPDPSPKPLPEDSGAVHVDDIDKVEKPLPEQGYNEFEPGPRIEHDNYYTWVGDWAKEWPSIDESHEATVMRICHDHPENSWCKRFAKVNKVDE